MGRFTKFLLHGFTTQKQRDLFTPGTLFEVRSKLGERLRGDEMKNKVSSILNRITLAQRSELAEGREVSIYALEIHAIIEKENILDGYGTYVFVPDSQKDTITLPLASTFAPPIELEDDEDPVKVLASCPDMETHVYQLRCMQDDFYPLNTWDRIDTDPIEEIFSIMETMQEGEYAGVSLVIGPPRPNHDLRGKQRIRTIEDPEYDADPGFFDLLGTLWRGEPDPEQQVDRMAGYKKQQLDPREKAEIDAISKKLHGDLFNLTIRVYASSDELAVRLVHTIMQRMRSPYNSLDYLSEEGSVEDLAVRREGAYGFTASTEEITTLWHVPAENTGEAGAYKLHRPASGYTVPEQAIKDLSFGHGEPGDIRYFLDMVNTGGDPNFEKIHGDPDKYGNLTRRNLDSQEG